MPQGPSRNPFEKWLKAIALGPGFSSGGVIADVQRINLLPGFQFNDSGLFLSGEQLGTGSFTHNVVWDQMTVSANIGALFPAAGTVHFSIKAIIAGLPTAIATLDFLAGGLTGGITIPSRYVMPGGTPFTLSAPNPADATLASVFGTVYLSLEEQS